MSAEQWVFIITAAVSLGAALMVVSVRNMIHAALWLVLTLFGIAALFVLLEAGFFAVAQVIIYIGAISILLIFVIMLTRRTMQDSGPQVNRVWWLAAILSVLLLIALAWMLSSWNGFASPKPELAAGADPLMQLGQALVSPNAYVLPFEVASILLLAALIGAIVVAWERKR